MANARRGRRKGVLFARAPTGSETCTFCLMLASRGAVYHTRKNAGEFKHFHRGCDCKVVPGFDGNADAEVVEGYDPKGMRERMAMVEKGAGLSFASGGDSRALGDYMRLLDPDWLLYGKTPKVGYADAGTAAKKAGDPDHPAEKRVAERLGAHGFRVVFVDDEPREYDADKGMYQVVGLPDLDTGLEIKNVSTSRSENTISKHIGKSKKKRGYAQIVIDVSENEGLTDEEARKMIANSLRRHRLASALLIRHDGGIETVYPK